MMQFSHNPAATTARPTALIYLVEDLLNRTLPALDGVAIALLLPIAVWILVSGIDDLVILVAFLKAWIAVARTPDVDPATSAARPIAILVPCWREDTVIEEMVAHNIAAIRYDDYEIFIGGYPNDEPTLEAAGRLEARYPRVHLCLCPHDGPTSKADCLNWIYQRMLLHEEEHGKRFDIVLTHDAEDLIHTRELLWVNQDLQRCDFVQVPVLPLATPFWKFTHGLYCDDFAECHTKDLLARQQLGGFIPSSGVGTGYGRDALERLAAAESNRIFEPSCLTEDYENGLRFHQMGCRQAFMPMRFHAGAPIATREYFPQDFRSALRQRTRWVTGIALQTWRRHGWPGGISEKYWLWRDRRGLVGSPVSLLANLLFVYGLLTFAAARLNGVAWTLGARLGDPLLVWLVAANTFLQCVHLAVRMGCTARIFGLGFALGVPFRVVYGNWLNSVAAFTAMAQFLGATLRHRPLVWVKTEHSYPSRVALLEHKRSLEEILVGSSYLTPGELARARSTKPHGVRLAEHLVTAGMLSEDELCEALGLQLGLALGKIDPARVSRNVARSLPEHIIREWNVLPVRIEQGNMLVASPDLPTEDLSRLLRRFTRLAVRVELVTPTNFRRLADALL